MAEQATIPEAMRRALGRSLTLASIRRLDEATKTRARADAMDREYAGLGIWDTLAHCTMDEAGTDLLRFIVGWFADKWSSLHDADRRYWPPCGVTAGGRAFLAIPEDDTELAGEGNLWDEKTRQRAMRLIEMDLSRLVDLDELSAEGAADAGDGELRRALDRVREAKVRHEEAQSHETGAGTIESRREVAHAMNEAADARCMAEVEAVREIRRAANCGEGTPLGGWSYPAAVVIDRDGTAYVSCRRDLEEPDLLLTIHPAHVIRLDGRKGGA